MSGLCPLRHGRWLARSRAMVLDAWLGLIALRLIRRLRGLIILRRKRIGKIWGGVVSWRGAWDRIGWGWAVLVGMAGRARAYPAVSRIGAKVRFGRLRQMLRLRFRSPRDRRIGRHLCKNRPPAGSKDRVLTHRGLARSTCSRSHVGLLAPMSGVCGRTPGLIALGTDAPETVGEIGLKLKGRTGVVPVPLIVHGHGTSPEPSPPPRIPSMHLVHCRDAEDVQTRRQNLPGSNNKRHASACQLSIRFVNKS